MDNPDARPFGITGTFGDITANTITGATLITGETMNANNITGTTITGVTGKFTSLTGTSITGVTITGQTGLQVVGVFDDEFSNTVFADTFCLQKRCHNKLSNIL